MYYVLIIVWHSIQVFARIMLAQLPFMYCLYENNIIIQNVIFIQTHVLNQIPN